MPSVVDVLSELIDKSMVQVEELAGEARYRVLETLRQYGYEKLQERGEATEIRRRHRRWYRSIVERAEPELTGAHQRFWLDRLQHDYENIRAVVEDSARHEADLGEGLHVGAALLRLWIVRGYLAEGRRLLEPLLDASQQRAEVRRSAAVMEALHTVGFAAYFQGDYNTMQTIAEEWLAIARDLNDERAIWMAADMQARVWMNRGEFPRARDVFVGQLEAMRRHGYAFGIASALIGLGVLARLQGDLQGAVRWCEDCLSVSRQSGDVWFVGQALSNAGLAYYHLGRFTTAQAHFAEALALRRDLGDRSGMAWSLINLGDVAIAGGQLNDARARFEESLAILRELGDRSGRADAVASLGRVAEGRSDFASARVCYLESLALRRDLGQRLAMPGLLEDLAGLAALQRDQARAVVLAGAAARLRTVLGAPQSAAEHDRVARWLTPLQELASTEGISWNDNQPMTLDQALEYALDDNPRLALISGDRWPVS
jgi:tetratricopeptide (TPR) repeat protein